MDDRLRLLLGTGLGALSMYYLDPARGRYRRAMVRNRLVHAGHEVQRGIGVVARDLRNRTLGVTAEARSMLDSSRPDDDVLVERVRSCLGRVVTHPASVHVDARDGTITLAGLILADEVPDLLDCVQRVHGVIAVRNELEVHAEPGRIPGLQGHPPRRAGHRNAFMQTHWPPAARLVGGLAGAAATLYGFGRRDTGGTLVGTAGVVVLARAATNLELGHLLGIGSTRHVVDLQKSIRIHAPVEQVFEVWEDFESFPKLMTHVRHVRPLEIGGDKRRWRWTIRGALGLQAEFDSVVTAREENRLIAWRTERSRSVRHSGSVHFHDNGDGSTTVDVRMTYSPVAGAIGHAVARLVGADPKHQMDDDLLRLKTFIETGRPPRDAAEPSAEPEERRRAEPEIPHHPAPPRVTEHSAESDRRMS